MRVALQFVGPQASQQVPSELFSQQLHASDEQTAATKVQVVLVVVIRAQPAILGGYVRTRREFRTVRNSPRARCKSPAMNESHLSEMHRDHPDDYGRGRIWSGRFDAVLEYESKVSGIAGYHSFVESSTLRYRLLLYWSSTRAQFSRHGSGNVLASGFVSY